ncbi:hypothetical protein ACWOEJ_03775 [Enterococcus eurekensis]|uniref:MucBP domain-containing protein n=1 Tax=Enterococcus eurekensis TaxID=1159753 RepID=A0ABV9M195_9ENTE
MKRYRVYVSLLLLVTLFFLIYPFQTTYAYFTDHTSVNGNISLKTGTLSLADIAASSLTFKTETKLPVTTVVKNTGSLDGKLTVKEISAIQDGKSVNYKEYFDVNVTFDDSNITASSIRNMTVIVTKKKDWAKEKLIELAIPVRISQTNVVGDQSGFIDQKIYRITLTNNSVTTPEWPEFKENGYIAQPLYRSVVDGKLTTVMPGVVYLKYTGKYIDEFKEEVKKQANGMNYTISELTHIANQGFKIVLTHREGTLGQIEDKHFSIIQFHISGVSNRINFHWGTPPFSFPLILSKDFKQIGHGDDPEIKDNFIINEREEIPFVPFTSWEPASEIRNKRLSEVEKEYFKKNIKLEATNPDKLNVHYTKDYSAMVLEAKTNGDLGYIELRDNNTKKVVFRRKVKNLVQSLDNQKINNAIESSVAQETTSTSQSISDVDFFSESVEMSKSESGITTDTQETETTESYETSSEISFIQESFSDIEEGSSEESQIVSSSEMMSEVGSTNENLFGEIK